MQGLGYPTKTVFLKGIESHKLHVEFEVSAAVKRGQPVKLDADGKVQPAGVDEPSKNIIGWSIHTAAVAGELVTVGMKAMGVIYASPKGALNAGPVAYDGLNTADNTYNSFKAVDSPGAFLAGWALEEAVGADELIRVAIL